MNTAFADKTPVKVLISDGPLQGGIRKCLACEGKAIFDDFLYSITAPRNPQNGALGIARFERALDFPKSTN